MVTISIYAVYQRINLSEGRLASLYQERNDETNLGSKRTAGWKVTQYLVQQHKKVEIVKVLIIISKHHREMWIRTLTLAKW